MIDRPVQARISRASWLWYRFCKWAWWKLNPICHFIYFRFLVDESKLKNKWLHGLREMTWTYLCGHDDFRFALHIGNIYWGIGK